MIDMSLILKYGPVNLRQEGLIYIYGLGTSTHIYYVGSTTKPVARYLEHLQEQTKNTKDLIYMLSLDGIDPVMKILDVCDKRSRIQIEAKWIKECGEINNEKFITQYQKYLLNKSLYPCLSDGSYPNS